MRRLNDTTLLVNKSSPVRIAIKTNSQIRTVPQNRLAKSFVESRQQRIRNPMRETTVRFAFKNDRLNPQLTQPMIDRSVRNTANPCP